MVTVYPFFSCFHQVALCLQERPGGDGASASADVVVGAHLSSPAHHETVQGRLRTEAGPEENISRNTEKTGGQCIRNVMGFKMSSKKDKKKKRLRNAQKIVEINLNLKCF